MERDDGVVSRDRNPREYSDEALSVRLRKVETYAHRHCAAYDMYMLAVNSATGQVMSTI